MGTKIYNAYCIPLCRLNEFLRLSQELAYKQVKRYMYNLLTSNMGNPTPKRIREEFFRMDGEKRHPFRLEDRPNFDSWWKVYILVDRSYLIPSFRVPTVEFKEILPNVDYLVEFGWWNNVDQPEDISDYDWEQRGKTWEFILEHCQPLIFNMTGKDAEGGIFSIYYRLNGDLEKGRRGDKYNSEFENKKVEY